MHRTILLALGLSAGCAPSGTYEATLTDAITREALGETRALLKTESNDFACQIFETTSDASGAVRFEGLCADYAYALSVPDGPWRVESAPIPGGEEGLSGGQVKVWPLPGKAGIWLRSPDGELAGVSTASDVTTQRIWDSEEEVRYPEQVPAKIPRVEPGGHLVLAGDAALGKTLHPLIKSGHIRVGTPDKFFNMEPWYYIGTSFEDAKTFERLEAEIDASKILEGRPEGTTAQYWPADLVPAGRYALLAEGDKRTHIVDFLGAAAGEPTDEGDTE